MYKIDDLTYWDVKDIKKILPLSRANIYILLHHANCPTLKIGKRLLVRRDLFMDFLNSLKLKEGLQ